MLGAKHQHGRQSFYNHQQRAQNHLPGPEYELRLSPPLRSIPLLPLFIDCCNMIVTLLVVAVSNVDFADFYMVVIAICSCCSLFNSVCRTQRKANLRRSYTLDI